MKCEMTGRLTALENSKGGKTTLTLDVEGRDSAGRLIEGELKVHCEVRLLKDVKISDFLTVTVETKNLLAEQTE